MGMRITRRKDRKTKSAADIETTQIIEILSALVERAN